MDESSKCSNNIDEPQSRSAIVARQSTRQFTQRDTHNQNVYTVTMRAGNIDVRGYTYTKTEYVK